ncbi:MoxR family ATPase [bacterium]|nr:MoxR family ATPase [bacterium]
MDESQLEPEKTPIEPSFEASLDLGRIFKSISQVRKELNKVIVGQNDLIEFLIIGILADGHCLIEGVPGIAKTLSAKLLARTLSVDFSRIQFTPDLMPSDILGTSIFNQKTTNFEFKHGPIFSNIILIDEINRAPAKTQAALFEVMAEKQITIDGNTYTMANPFIVFATQNPIEQEGTYRLPEAQLDRFLFKINLDYPDLEDEIKIIEKHNSRKGSSELAEINAVLNAKDIQEMQQICKQITVEKSIVEYIAKIVYQTRVHPALYLGSSPRASIAILSASKAKAAISGRDFVIPEDVKYVASVCMRHRVTVSPEKEMEGLTADYIIKEMIESVEVPR